MKSKYFSESEFICDGDICYDKMNENLIKMLHTARKIADIPFVINSSWRSEEHNAKIGGSKNSAHLRGNAVDISCTNSNSRLIIVNALIVAGFTRIGIGKTFIHCDVDETLPQNVMWVY